MDDEYREQIQSMLADTINNMDYPSDYPSHGAFKRDWLNAVAEIASNMAKELQL